MTPSLSRYSCVVIDVLMQALKLVIISFSRCAAEHIVDKNGDSNSETMPKRLQKTVTVPGLSSDSLKNCFSV